MLVVFSESNRMMYIRSTVLLLALVASCCAFAKRDQLHAEKIVIEANRWRNKTVDFWVHRPAGYDAATTNLYPVLVYFGGRNNKGKD